MHLLLQVALVTEAESDVSNQNVTFSTQSLSDFEIVRPAENKQG